MYGGMLLLDHPLLVEAESHYYTDNMDEPQFTRSRVLRSYVTDGAS